MKSFFSNFFGNQFSCCRRHKTLSIVLTVGIITMMVIGIIGGIRLNNSMFPQDFSNVSYVKFLKGNTKFTGFFFSNLCTILIFAMIMVICGFRPYLMLISGIFFLYYVYAQTVTVVSIMMEFGFFNTLVIVLFLIIISICYFLLFFFVFINCADMCKSPNYFPTTLRLVVPLLIAFLVVVLICIIFLITLKNFVIILVYK